MQLQRTAVTHEFLDERGRRFTVRFSRGKRAAFVAGGVGELLVKWQREWGPYQPQSEATAVLIVQEFVRQQELQQPLERVNAELASAGRRQKYNGQERALPVGDRG